MTEQQSDNLELQGVYANVYNEIAQPDRVFVASQYFRQQWVPLLGHALAWLIIALRQRCYWNRSTGEFRDWCRVAQDELAAEIGVDPRTLRRLLQHEQASRFILAVEQPYHYNQRLGKTTRQVARYRVRMDDPLTPADEARLRQRLADELAGLDLDPETGQRNMLALLDQLVTGADHLPDKMSARSGEKSDLPDKMSARSSHLPDKMSGRSYHLPDKMSGATGHLPDKMSGSLSTFKVPDPDPVLDHHQQYPAAVLSAEQLPQVLLSADEVLVPVYDGAAPESTDPAICGYVIAPLTTVVQYDLLAWQAQRARGGLLQPTPARREVYYSVAQALGQGGAEWTPEEEARLDQHARLEQDLQTQFERLGAVSLEAALGQFFANQQLVAQFLVSASAAERARQAAWVAETRRLVRARRLDNPPGFLRSKIESGEQPPDPSSHGRQEGLP